MTTGTRKKLANWACFQANIMFIPITEELKHKIQGFSLYAADVIVSTSVIILGVIVLGYSIELQNTGQDFGPYCLVSTCFLLSGFTQLFHVEQYLERRAAVKVLHNINLFIAFAIWLTLAVTSFFDMISPPSQITTHMVLCALSFWVFIRYGDL